MPEPSDTVVVEEDNGDYTVITVGEQGPAGLTYTLPAATTTTLGGVIISTGLSITANGTLTADAAAASVTSVNAMTGAVVVNWGNLPGAPNLAVYALQATTITAGTGLSGGGDLSTNRSIALASTSVTAGSYGSATAAGTFTVDAQGRLTAASSVTVTPAFASITGKPTTLSGYGITDGITAAAAASTYQTIAGMSAYATTASVPTAYGSTPAAVSTTGAAGSSANWSKGDHVHALPATAVTAAAYGSASQVATFTVDSYGRLTAAASVAIAITFASLTSKPMTLAGYGITDAASLGANTFTGTQNLAGNLLTSAKVQAYSETSTAPTIASGTLTLDLSGSNVFRVALNAAITTLSITNIPASGTAASFTLLFTADGTARAVTWPASVKWPGGTAPTLTSTNNKVDSFSFSTTDGGTTWLAYKGGQNF